MKDWWILTFKSIQQPCENHYWTIPCSHICMILFVLFANKGYLVLLAAEITEGNGWFMKWNVKHYYFFIVLENRFFFFLPMLQHLRATFSLTYYQESRDDIFKAQHFVNFEVLSTPHPFSLLFFPQVISIHYFPSC